MADWIDVTVALRDGMTHWPENPPFRLRSVKELARGGSSNVSEISLGTHTGTHIDAPAHFLPGAAGAEALPLKTAIGSARVIEIKDPESITERELTAHRPRIGERLLFKTRNSATPWSTEPFKTDFVYLSTGAARLLASKRPKLVGIDYLSVGGYKKNGRDAHHALLEAGAWIVEGLDLSRVRPGAYEMICLPLKLAGADGAPARVVLRKVPG